MQCRHKAAAAEEQSCNPCAGMFCLAQVSCLATSHFRAGYPFCLGPRITVWEGIPILGPEFGRSVGTGSAQCGCFHLLS